MDLYGQVSLQISLKIQGKSGEIFFDGTEESVGFAGFGGRVIKANEIAVLLWEFGLQ